MTGTVYKVHPNTSASVWRVPTVILGSRLWHFGCNPGELLSPGTHAWLDSLNLSPLHSSKQDEALCLGAGPLRQRQKPRKSGDKRIASADANEAANEGKELAKMLSELSGVSLTAKQSAGGNLCQGATSTSIVLVCKDSSGRGSIHCFHTLTLSLAFHPIASRFSRPTRQECWATGGRRAQVAHELEGLVESMEGETGGPSATGSAPHLAPASPPRHAAPRRKSQPRSGAKAPLALAQVKRSLGAAPPKTRSPRKAPPQVARSPLSSRSRLGGADPARERALAEVARQLRSLAELHNGPEFAALLGMGAECEEA